MDILRRNSGGVPGGFLDPEGTIFSKAVPSFPELVSECPDISFGKVELTGWCVQDKVSSICFIGER